MILDDALDVLSARARKEVDEGLLPSAQWALALDGKVVAGETVGDAPAGDDSRYVIYSCTKAVVASAIWQLLAEGSIGLPDRVADLVPEFASNGKDVITVEQVLLHTAGFPYAPMPPRRWSDRDARLVAIAGTHVVSSSSAIAVVGNVYTHPAHRGQHLAQATTRAVTAQLLRFCRDVVLSVDPDNAAAVRAYQRLGYREVARLIEGAALRRDVTGLTAAVRRIAARARGRGEGREIVRLRA